MAGIVVEAEALVALDGVDGALGCKFDRLGGVGRAGLPQVDARVRVEYNPNLVETWFASGPVAFGNPQTTVPVTAAQPMSTGAAPAAPPMTMFWAVRRFNHIV